MTTQEQTYKVTFHLIDGTKLEASIPVGANDLMEIYGCLDAKESRVKFPTAPDTLQLMPASSVLRIEAVGEFE